MLWPNYSPLINLTLNLVKKFVIRWSMAGGGPVYVYYNAVLCESQDFGFVWIGYHGKGQSTIPTSCPSFGSKRRLRTGHEANCVSASKSCRKDRSATSDECFHWFFEHVLCQVSVKVPGCV